MAFSKRKRKRSVPGKCNPRGSLVAVLDEAQYVRHDEERGLLLVWSGAHSCSAYNQHGQEVTHWNMGDFAENSAGFEEVRENFEALIASGEYLEFYK
jgi:hypothetical protein